jgi:integrase
MQPSSTGEASRALRGARRHSPVRARAADAVRSVMDRMGHTLIQTTQKYLHTLRDADQRNLDAFRRITDPTEFR